MRTLYLDGNASIATLRTSVELCYLICIPGTLLDDKYFQNDYKWEVFGGCTGVLDRF